LGKEVTGKTC